MSFLLGASKVFSLGALYKVPLRALSMGVENLLDVSTAVMELVSCDCKGACGIGVFFLK